MSSAHPFNSEHSSFDGICAREKHTRKAKDTMHSLNLIVIVAVGIVLAFTVTLFAATRRPLFTEDEIRNGKRPQGYFLSIGMTACIALGILAGLVLGSVPAGVAIGVGLGLVVGRILEKRFNGDASPFTEQEKQEL